MNETTKLCFLAPTGFGKTTAVNIIEKIYGSKNIKLAKPLYKIQDYIYSTIGVDTENKQDGQLLQFLGEKIQREKPDYLANAFYEQMQSILSNNNIEIITNDDCRPHNYMYLKNMGFKFIKIDGFSRIRDDHTSVNPNHSVEWKESDIMCDIILENHGNLEQYESNITKMMEGIVYAK